MSLEQAIQENTIAIRDLIKAMAGATPHATPQPAAEPTQQGPGTKPVATPPAAESETVGKSLLDTVSQFVLDTVKADPSARLKLLPVLKDFGVKRVSALKPEQLPAAYEALKAAVA